MIYIADFYHNNSPRELPESHFIMVQGCIVFITAAYVMINALVDFGYVILDPRIRRERSIG